MPLEAFREDPKEFGRDLTEALECQGAKNPGAVAERWFGGRIGRKTDILREHFPSEEQFMFALREFCTLGDAGVHQRLQRLGHREYGGEHAEYTATAIGRTAVGGKSSLPSLPSRPDLLIEEAMLLSARTVRKRGGIVMETRARRIADGLHKQAGIARVSLTPEGAPRSLEVLRTRFRVRLMQALTWDGYTTQSLQSVGMGEQTALRLLARHQVGGRNPAFTNVPQIDTVNDVLRLLRSFEESQAIAQEFFRLYRDDPEKRPALRAKIRGVLDTAGVREEGAGKHRGERYRRAGVEMLARAAGVRDLLTDEALENPCSPERQELERFLSELGLGLGTTRYNSPDVAQALLRARECFHSVIWFGAVTRR